MPDTDVNIIMMNVVRRNCLSAADFSFDTSKASPEEIASYHYCT